MILDLTNAEAVGGVTLEQTQTAAERAGGIRKGDMAFGQMGNTCYFATATLDWLVEQGIKLMGVDLGDVDLSYDETRANINYLVLFRAGIPLIENLDNLDQLTQRRVLIHTLPVPVNGLDAFPLA